MARRKRFKRARRQTVADVVGRMGISQFKEAFARAGRIGRAVFNAYWNDGKLSMREERNADVKPISTPGDGFRCQVVIEPRTCKLCQSSPRWVFVCGACGSDRRFLYIPRLGSELICRDCAELPYVSTARWNNVKRTGYPAGHRGRDSKYGGGPKRILWRALELNEFTPRVLKDGPGR